MNIVEVIETEFVNFSLKERLIATYLLQEQDQLGNISINDLAKNIGTSAATITRFCRKIGCGSFVELKMALQVAPAPSTGTQTNDMFNTVTQFYERVINRTAEQLAESQINQVIQAIRASNRIVVYGIGSSGLTAKEFAMRLSRMGLNAVAETDAHLMIISSAITQEDDIVIGISNSGKTKEVVHAIKNAKENKAKTVSMTSIKGSLLSKLTDEVLFVHSSRFVNNEQFVNSQLPFYYLIDIMTLKLLEDSEYAKRMQITVEEILEKTIQMEDEIHEV